MAAAPKPCSTDWRKLSAAVTHSRARGFPACSRAWPSVANAAYRYRLGKGPDAVARLIVQGRADQTRTTGRFSHLAEAPIEGLERVGQKLVERLPIAGEEVVLGNGVDHRGRIDTPVRIAFDMAAGLLVAAVHRQQFLRGDVAIAAQAIDHVIHVDRLIDRPGRAMLIVGEVGVRQIDLGLYRRCRRDAGADARRARDWPGTDR